VRREGAIEVARTAAGTGLGLQGVIATVLGNAAEFYDFTAFAAFATSIAHAYFPGRTPIEGVLLTLASFGLGFLTRPIGGIVIGAYADRAGRRPAMTLTIVLMALGTGMIAVIPSYARIGLAAPLLVLVARLIQGFAVGGEVGPSTAYLLEAAPPGQRARYGSWQSASQGIATIVAGFLGFSLSLTLSPEQLDDWGWRVPFALGVLILPIGLYIRRRLDETLDLETIHPTAGQVVLHSVTRHWRGIVLGIMAVSGGTVATYVNLYLTTYAQTTLGIVVGKSMLATFVVGAVGIAAPALGGIAADRWSRRLVVILPRVLIAVLAIPAFSLLADQRSLSSLLWISALSSLLNGISSGTLIVQVADSFPPSVRSTTTAATYAISVAVFGGTTQYVLAQLVVWTGNPVAPAYYLALMTIPTVVAAYFLRPADET
jgi:MFS family permease